MDLALEIRDLHWGTGKQESTITVRVHFYCYSLTDMWEKRISHTLHLCLVLGFILTVDTSNKYKRKKVKIKYEYLPQVAS